MADYLKNFAEDETILASDTNSNNQYLLDRIGDNYTRLKTWLEGEVGRINSNMQSGDATLQKKLDDLQQSITTINNNFFKNITPDYTKGTSVGLPLKDKPFTAPKHGMYFANVGVNNQTRYLYINGVQALRYVDTAERVGSQTFFVPLLKGDKIYWSDNLTVNQSTFYPYRGL